MDNVFVFLFWLAVFYWLAKKIVDFVFPAWKKSDPSGKRKRSKTNE